MLARQPHQSHPETAQAERLAELEWLVDAQERELQALRDLVAEPYPAELHAALRAADGATDVTLRILARAVRSATQTARLLARAENARQKALSRRILAAVAGSDREAAVKEALKGEV